MKNQKKLYTIHRNFTILTGISLILGIVFFVTNNLDFIINAITYGKASFPNIAYWLSKIVGTILIPLVFLVPSLSRFERIKFAKYSFILYGVLQILTLSWIFWYFAQNGLNGFFSNESVAAFQSSGEVSFVAPYIYWGTYSWTGNIMTLLYGVLCIYTGFIFDDNKQKVCICVTAVAVLRLVLPIICSLVCGNEVMSSLWLTNNYADIISFGTLAAAVIIASTFDESWISLIWDQEIPQNEDDE